MFQKQFVRRILVGCILVAALRLGTGGFGAPAENIEVVVKFACVDGPDFDGHKVDYDELMSRNSVYREREAEERKTHICRIQKMGEELIK